MKRFQKQKFVQTDDLQYMTKKSDDTFYFIEAREDDEDTYVICTGHIDISDYLDSNGEYDADAVSLIHSYYGSVKDFEENYPNKNDRKQLFAEMCFESIPHHELDFWTVETDNPEQEIENTIEAMGGIVV